MADIKYNIDITETGYKHFEGTSSQELETFLYPDENFKDCCGTITYIGDKGCVNMSVASVSKYGVYIGVSDKKHTYLSISDRSKLSSVVDVWGDGLYISEGLFISPQSAWKCICELLETGNLCREVDWITPDELPEEGNYI